MLFPYTYLAGHKMEKMQSTIDYIFHEVWCKAGAVEYSLDLFENQPDLKVIMADLFARDLAGKLTGSAKDFYKGVNAIFIEFKLLSEQQIQRYTRHYNANNDLVNLCAASPDCQPITYFRFSGPKLALDDKIEDFFTKLYSSGFFNIKLVENQFGSTLKEYYKDFVRKNDDDVCPFCGLFPLDNEYDPTREAFDHYLPKSKYPFNSVNLKNLAPSCNKCNSGNKRDQDPLCSKDGQRRKAFNPFSAITPKIDLAMSLQGGSWDNITKDMMSIETNSTSNQEEVNTWAEIFRIHDRYLAKCCSKNGGKGWLNRIFIECSNGQKTPGEVLAAELDYADVAPMVETNFLKKAFLEACDQAGVFSEQPAV